MIDEAVRDLDYSNPFNYHLWSDHPASDRLVSHVQEKYFPLSKYKYLRKHLKVILLNLYLCWSEDPNKSVGIGMSNSNFPTKSRYNALSISNKMIEVINQLHQKGLISKHTGSEYSRRRTRIWVETPLIDIFNQTGVSVLMLQTHKDKETIILRDIKDTKSGKVKVDVEYHENSLEPALASKIKSMRAILKSYNNALDNTFIDIPTLEDDVITSKKSYNGAKHHLISQHSKHVYRVFNNGSFEQGGRFYGGWWQNIPKEYRKDIFIDDASTVEIDFKSLHIMLLYAQLGLDIDEELEGSDAYQIHVPFAEDSEEARRIGKKLMLICINARNENAALRAFQNELATEDYNQRGFKLSFDNLRPLIAALKDKHPKIQDKFCSNAGIHLMNLDSDLAEIVLCECLDQNITPLIIHDSFIVQAYDEQLVRQFMSAAVRKIVGSSSKMSVTINERLYMSEFNEEHEAVMKTERYKKNYDKWKEEVLRSNK